MKRLLRNKHSIRWTCLRCLSSTTPHPLTARAGSLNVQDDQLIRDIFDSYSVWSSFNTSKSKPTGLFLNEDLIHPGGFKYFAKRILTRTQQLVEDISEEKRPATIIQDLDRLSDLLCSVSDLTAFIRTVHPNPQVAQEAHKTFSDVVRYMNGLNQHEKLYQLTAKANPRSRQEKAVQRGLLHDFEQSGMSLSPAARQEFVSLSSEAIVLERTFNGNTGPAEAFIEFNVDELRGLHQSDLRSISNGTKAKLPTSGRISQKALILAESEDIRRRIWEAQNTGRQEQIRILERLLEIRRQLSQLTRYKSYAEAKLADKMAKSPGTLCFTLLT